MIGPMSLKPKNIVKHEANKPLQLIRGDPQGSCPVWDRDRLAMTFLGAQTIRNLVSWCHKLQLEALAAYPLVQQVTAGSTLLLFPGF